MKLLRFELDDSVIQVETILIIPDSLNLRLPRRNLKTSCSRHRPPTSAWAESLKIQFFDLSQNFLHNPSVSEVFMKKCSNHFATQLIILHTY